MNKKLCPHCGQPMEIPDEEQEAAELRCKQLDRLDNACGWGLYEWQLAQSQISARLRYRQIMEEQSVFENKYC